MCEKEIAVWMAEAGNHPKPTVLKDVFYLGFRAFMQLLKMSSDNFYH